MIWLAVLLASVGCYVLKLAGMSVPRAFLERDDIRRVAMFLPVSMLAALVVVEALDGGGQLRFDPALLAGVGAGVVALAVRRSFLVVIVVAAATAGVLRAVT
jgi:branched-subunit amino acid transport protein